MKHREIQSWNKKLTKCKYNIKSFLKHNQNNIKKI